MNIGIIHLTDLHVKKDSKLEKFFDGLLNKIINKFQKKVEKLFLVFSGDIAFSGKKEEYQIATEYIDLLKKEVNERIGIELKLIMVPGNHDCNFNYEDQVRKNLIKNINYDFLGDDESVIKTCMKVQNDFWEFYKKYNSEPNNKLYYSINDEKVCFHCYNTAWMSQLKEKPGTLFFPVKLIEKKMLSQEDCSLCISVYHHPINWFNPDTKENNKEEFRLHMEKFSSIQIVGHEHEKHHREETNYDIGVSSNIFYGAAFVNSDGISSGFQLIYLNLNEGEGLIYEYIYDNDRKEYERNSKRRFQIDKRDNTMFKIKNYFIDKNEDIKIPLSINNHQPKLSQIFIYPDLRPISSNYDTVIEYIDSKRIIEEEENCLIEGDSQSGKSALLFMYFKDFYNRGYFPLLINSKTVKNFEIDKFLRKNFMEIYEGDYEDYQELSREKKVLLIDDFNNITIRKKDGIEKILNELTKNFDKIIITINTEIQLLPYFYEILKDFKRYEIVPFGYEKRDKLIEKYLILEDNLSVDEQQFHNKVKTIFDKMQQIIGDKLIPAYPIYLVSILQALVHVKEPNLHLTSYGHCYQSLITLALLKHVSPEDIDSFINFLKEVAFYLYKNDIKNIKLSEIQNFIIDYKKEYVIKDSYDLIDVLIKSCIFKKEDDYLRFKYKYIFYFFVAQYISENKENENIKCVISKLIDELYLPENANILVFIAHHVRDLSFILDFSIATMYILENKRPITLEKDDDFYHSIKSIVKNISKEIIEDRDPKEERKEMLRMQDKYQQLNRKKEEEDHEINKLIPEELKEIIKATKAIEVLGQIIKNRYGSLKIKEQKETIEILYENAFRLIRAISELLENSKDSLKKELEKEIKKDDEKIKIEKKINKFTQFLELLICLGVFSKLIYSVGVKELKEIFNEVAEKINTPAAKLVSFGINSYYNPISVKELKELAKEFENNPVAFQILRSRVISYLYENYVGFNKKQQIADIMKLDMKKMPMLGRENYA